MNGVDTNVIVRYVTGDDAAQSATARELMLQVRDEDDTLLINNIVLCELVWVMESAYGFEKADVVTTLQKLLATRQLEFEDRDIARRALGDYQSSSADFADCLIGSSNQFRDCSTTWTFDRSAQKLPYFEAL